MADLTLDIINDKELLKLFNELVPKVQNQIIQGGFKTAGKIINDAAKQNFDATKKNKSRTGYADFNKFFRVKPLRAPKIGAVVGMSSREGYKYRFENFGTTERQYRTKKGEIHKTGKINATHFFDDAVDSKKDEAMKAVNNAIVQSMEKTVAKYNKKYRL